MPAGENASDGDAPALRVRAVEAMRLATLNPGIGRALAEEVLPAAETALDWMSVSISARAAGVAAMNLNDLDPAVRRLTAAVRAGERAKSPLCVGQALMSLASAHVLRGKPGQAMREIDQAVRVLDDLPAARARVQRAAILQELGRDDEALKALATALPLLIAAGDAEWAVRGLSNRSLLHVARRAFSPAQRDLEDARALCISHSLGLPAAIAEQNLGCLDAKRGDVPKALSHFDVAEERYLEYGLEEGSLFVDRAELLLSVRLVSEARTAAETAVAVFERQERTVHLPEAQLLLSTVALVQGDKETALDSARQAEQNFRRLKRTASLPLARYAAMQAMLAIDPAGLTQGQVSRAADRLAAAGWPVPALEARVLAARQALVRGRPDEASTQLSLASRARFSGPADARARAWLAEALLRRAHGRERAALAALRAGLRIVDDYQTTLGATELRAHVSLHRGALGRVGLRMAVESGKARRTLWWAERTRASALLTRPLHPPDDPVIAAELTDLRATMAEIEELRRDGGDAGELVKLQVTLERRIRDRSRTLSGAGGSGRPRVRSAHEISEVLGEAALVEYIELEGELYAVVLAGGRSRLWSLGPFARVREAMRLLPFHLQRLANPRTHPASRAGAAAAMTTLARSLQTLLVGPLLRHLGERPVVLVPAGELQSLPWSILPSFSGRAVTVTPSATLWHAATALGAATASLRVVAVAGPGLPEAPREVAAVARRYPRTVRLVNGDATASALASEADGADLLHLAAHGEVRSDNPLFSSVTLADGPFTVYDFEGMKRPPRHVILAACDTARPHLVGEEILGFGAALLSRGTTSLVAPVVAIPDTDTVRLMCEYHDGLASGLSPAESLARVQASVGELGSVVHAAAAAFVCLGAGQVAVAMPPLPEQSVRCGAEPAVAR